MDEIKAAADAFGLPVKIQITQPDDDHTFWVSLIGRGYPKLQPVLKGGHP
jgi:DNA sulfur modification protein DndC